MSTRLGPASGGPECHSCCILKSVGEAGSEEKGMQLASGFSGRRIRTLAASSPGSCWCGCRREMSVDAIASTTTWTSDQNVFSHSSGDQESKGRVPRESSISRARLPAVAHGRSLSLPFQLLVVVCTRWLVAPSSNLSAPSSHPLFCVCDPCTHL